MYFKVSVPISPLAQAFGLGIVAANSYVSYHASASLSTLVSVIVIYTLVLTPSEYCMLFASLLSLWRLAGVMTFTVDIRAVQSLGPVALFALLALTLVKLASSSDVSQLLTLLDVKLLDPPILYLKILDQTVAYFSWEHASPERLLQEYQIEINNVIIGSCQPHERSIGIPGLRPNTVYRVRIWANSNTRGKVPSSHLMFKTLDRPSGTFYSSS